MTSSIKRSLSLLFVLLLTVFCLAACSQVQGDHNGGNGGNNNVTENGGNNNATENGNNNATENGNNNANNGGNGGGQQNACANGHTPGAWVVDKPATLDEAGQEVKRCALCKSVLDTKEIAKLIASEGLAYEINEDGTTCTITGIGTCTDTDLVIPRAIDGYTVTAIGDYAFEDCTGLTSVVIGDSVTSIGEYAFSDCTGLTSVVIPDSVTSIGNEAFYYCTGLTSVVIGNSVTSIGRYAFEYCYKLVEVYNLSPHIAVTKGAEGNGYLGFMPLTYIPLLRAPASSGPPRMATSSMRRVTPAIS